MDDQRLGKFTFDVLFHSKQELLDARDHEHNLLLGAISQCLTASKGVLDALDLLHTDNHVFLGRRLSDRTRWLANHSRT